MGPSNIIVDAINIFCKDTGAQILSPDSDTNFFEILTGVLLGRTFVLFMFIIVLNYALKITSNAEQNFF